MYFVHSLHAVPDDPAVVVATCDYGGPVTAAVERANVAAVQFHPEKSARAGLALLAGWALSIPTGRAPARSAS
jgi:glutamine amidotransferase